MWNVFYLFIFIIFNLIIVFLDIIKILPYIIIVYFYLLTPFYYLVFCLLGYIRLMLPFLIVYFIMCYNYNGYKALKFFGISLIPLKYKINIYLLKFKYKDKYYLYIYFILLFIFIVALMEEIFLLNFIIFIYFNISIYYKIYRSFNLNIKLHLYLNLFLLILIIMYINLFLNLYKILNVVYIMEDSIWELYSGRLILRYFYNKMKVMTKQQEEENEGILKKVWRYITEKNKLGLIEESEENKYQIKNYIYLRFSWIYSKLIKSYNNYINHIYNTYDYYEIENKYYQTSLESNWNNVYKIIKSTDNLILNKDININNNKLLYDITNTYINKSDYDITLYNKNTNINNLRTYNQYKKYIKLMWDELNTYIYFLPFGSNYINPFIDEGLDYILEFNKLDLKALSYTKNNINKDNYIYDFLLDDILWHKYKNFNIKKLEKYYSLYYNKDLININLENFIFNYIKDKHLYYDSLNMVNNEITIMEKLTEIKFNNIKWAPKNEVEFKDKNNFQRFFGIFFIINYLPHESWLGKHLDNYLYFFDKPEKLEKFNIYDSNKKEEYIEWEEYNLNYIKDDNILYNMFLEKKDKIRIELDDQNYNVNFNYYYNKRIKPSNWKLDNYWEYKLDKYNVNYNNLYYYILEELKDSDNNK